MGFYINEVRGNPLPYQDKASILLKLVDGSREIEKPTEWVPDLVCVVENPYFDAAAYAFDEREFEEFADTRDNRKKRWLIVPGAADFSGYTKFNEVHPK